MSFYKVLFLLTCIQLVKEVKSFVKNNVVVVDGQCKQIPTGTYILSGLTLLFYIMVLSLCMIPSLLW